MSSKRKVGTGVLLLMIANFAVKFFGLFREILIATYYGTTSYTDAYIIANSIPTVLFSAFAASISSTYIPMYSKACKEENHATANAFTIHLMEVMTMICLAMILLGEIFTKEITFLFAPGFGPETFKLTVSFVRILFPSILAMIYFDVLGGYMQIHEKYFLYALVPVIGNLVIIGFLFLSNYLHNIDLFVWGTLLGLLSQVLFYLPWAWKSGLFQAKWGGMRSDPFLKKMVPLLMPVFIGGAVNEINSLVDKSLVSRLDTGSVAALSYSYKIVILVTGVMVGAVVAYQYPKLSKLASEKKYQEFSAKGRNTIGGLFAFLFPISVMVIVYRTEIIRIFFQRGSFDDNSVQMTAAALAFYAIGISMIGVRDVLVKMFYSLQNTRIPMINGMLAAGINIILDIVLIQTMQHRGAAFATSLSAAISVVILMFLLNKHGFLKWGEILPSMASTIIAGGLMGLVGTICYNRFLQSGEITLLYMGKCILVGVFSLILYLVIQVLMGNPLLKMMKNTKKQM